MRGVRINITQPDAPTGNTKFGAKQDVASMLGICRRSVDNLMARGLPHLKIGKRTVRFNLTEVAAWMHERYGTTRMGTEGGR